MLHNKILIIGLLQSHTFSLSLAQVNLHLSATDLDHLVDDYQVTLSRLIDHHAPVKEKVIKTRP